MTWKTTWLIVTLATISSAQFIVTKTTTSRPKLRTTNGEKAYIATEKNIYQNKDHEQSIEIHAFHIGRGSDDNYNKLDGETTNIDRSKPNQLTENTNFREDSIITGYQNNIPTNSVSDSSKQDIHNGPREKRHDDLKSNDNKNTSVPSSVSKMFFYSDNHDKYLTGNRDLIPDSILVRPSDNNNNVPNLESIDPDNNFEASGEEPEIGTIPGNPIIGDDTNEASGGGDPGTDSNQDTEEDYAIETDKGKILGIEWQGSKDIIAYLDIPYGKFDTAFEAPKDPASWSEPHKVTEHGKLCPQMDGDSYVGGQDCLTLSVFIPRLSPAEALSEPETLTPVLFYIHESNFQTGSGNPALYGPEYLVPKNITLVLPNYRLGPLGFVCLRNSTAPGNAALKDLALALDWTVKNIRKFGGNPKNIAVSGDGTSAALAGLLALSPMTRQAVSKVIADSGSVLAHWAVDRDPISTAQQLVDSITKNKKFTIDKKRLVLDTASFEILVTSTKNIKIRPCVESDGFLTNTPWNALREGSFDNITFLLGSANHAGLVRAMQQNEEGVAQITKDFSIILPDDLAFRDSNDRNIISQQLRNRYFGIDGPIDVADRNFSLYFTDASYLGPVLRAARELIAAEATVFLYEFSFVGKLNKELNNIKEGARHGATRGDIVGYLFTQDGRTPDPDTKEAGIVNQMAELWTSFLHKGAPEFEEVVWPPATTSAESLLEIGLESPTLRPSVHEDRLQFWTLIYQRHFIDAQTDAAFRLPANIVLTAFLAFVLSFMNM